MENQQSQSWHGTTIISVRKGNQVVVAGDGQVSLGNTVIKGTAQKVRKIGDGSVIAGFAGADYSFTNGEVFVIWILMAILVNNCFKK